MATELHTVYATSSPAIIDLRQSSAGAKAKDNAKGLLDIQNPVKNNPQDVYPSPPSGASEDEQNDVDVDLALSLEDTEISDCADSDTMDGMTDATSIADGESSGSSFMDQDVEVEAAPSFDLPRMILQGLSPTVQGAPKTIPTMVLYDDRGLQLFDEITYLDEYYLTQEEIEILERDGDKIVENIPDNSVVVELGAGSLRKTVLLLNALERKRKNIRYYALDLMLDELTKSLKSLGHFANVKTAGLWGTYDEGLAFVSSFGPDVPKTLLWLGSSIGNLNREEAKDFIASYRKTLNVGDNWLIGIDRRNDAQEITVAYNDPKGITSEFVMNGLSHINVILGQDFIDREKFQYFAQYNVEAGRHEAYYQVKETHELVYRVPDTEGDNNHIKGRDEIRIQLHKDELINVEYSYKWSPMETLSLFEQAEMTKVGQWTSESNRYDLHLVRKAPFYFKPSSSDSMVCPSQEEWTELWKSWDVVTMSMIQHPSMLLEKPIALRHPFLFYLGHIPVFLDTQLSRCLKEPFSEPAYFNDIFERGIDPDVDDPTKCHSHSAVPETWPAIESIIDFRDRVRERLFKVLNDSVTYPMSRRLARVLFMAFEHEAMHLETLIYMLVQSHNTLAPPSVPAPWDLKSKMKGPAQTSGSVLTPATWISIDPSTLDSNLLSLGHNDSEANDLAEDKRLNLEAAFGWDNEHPLVTPKTVPSAFKIQSRQVSNSEFLAFMQSAAKMDDASMIPASWQMEGQGALPQEGVCVRTVYGPVPLTVSGEWPVSCSNVQATAYVTWYSSQHNSNNKKSVFTLPTEHELSIAFKLKQESVPKTGMENYGFRRWYPTTDDQVRGALTSPSSSSPQAVETMQAFSGPGGLWDWTSTPFAPLVTDGFETSQLYPGYSSDFFDGKHLVVLGASWATHPRIAERRSFRNWYQGNYPFVFAGFRLVEHC
ncbi:hypothetical protein KVV02_002151 [Mortierella alpina]|uniref:Uncharacterized protein n=1 Tax=Mortierella alpina TaxID=64518 RepID=A0A9P8CVA8_MORAP|nr:hypothetical protein KVV02_002151 [Mortierella alpina]